MDQERVGAVVQGELFNRRRSEIPEAERVLTLQEKLYQKAKQERGYKFYVLYDKMFIPYMLLEAWKTVKGNGGTSGVDGITIADVEKYGVEKYLKELGEDLRKKTYKPQAVRRVMIPKANGGERPLGIPTVRDRVAQTVCKMILEPIFEADFEESSYGFRPGRSSKEAITAIKENLRQDKTAVYDADLSKYFDTIPHDKLQIALKERISDPRLLKLITKWLKAPVYEGGQYKSGSKNHTGTPQGGVISPLLANVYLHLIDRIVNNARSLFWKKGVRIVRYADDFVLMGKTIPEEVIAKLKTLLNRMGLKLNESKTRQIEAKEESFNFLGFTIRYDKDIKGRGTRYWNIMPSKKSEQKIRDKVKGFLKTHGHSKAKEVAEGINTIIRGWLNYYEIKGVSYPAMSKRRLRFYLSNRLYRYYKRKSQRRCRLYGQRAFEVLTDNYGLIDPTKYVNQMVRL
ncbi:MAG: group II intron reverse transcriptase/maturase [Sphaerochaetaceae bacterium]|nr:group II intron reverse transcriptase/maturase [Sphaerochaetaceae bacterium]